MTEEVANFIPARELLRRFARQNPRSVEDSGMISGSMQILRLASCLVVAAACGGSAPSAPGPDVPQVLPELRITKTDPADLDRVFQVAIEALVREDYELAAREFDRVVDVLPGGPLAPEARLNAGIAYLSLGRLDEGEARLLDARQRGGRARSRSCGWRDSTRTARPGTSSRR